MFVVLGAVVAAAGSLASAVGFLSPPESAPVGIAVYKQHSGSAYDSRPQPGGGFRSVSLYFDSQRGLSAAAAPAIPPLGVSKSSSSYYSGYVTSCTASYYCTQQAYSYGSLSRGDITFNPLTMTIRFKKLTSCGVIDVSFSPNLPPRLFTQQGVIPNPNGITLNLGGGGDANASAFGSVCGYPLSTTNAYLSGQLNVLVDLKPVFLP